MFVPFARGGLLNAQRVLLSNPEPRERSHIIR